MPDQSASQTLYEALKTFLSAPPAPHPWWYGVLKDFQPLLAAAAALFAAGLAFRASMAKVWFDADEATKKRKAERLAVYLRLQMATGRLQGRIRDILERPETEVEQMEERALVLEIPPAIDEIEERLDLFNRADGFRFYYVKAELVDVGEMIASEDSWQKTTNFETGKARRTLKPDVLRRYKQSTKYIAESASSLDQGLMDRVQELYDELHPPVTRWRRFPTIEKLARPLLDRVFAKRKALRRETTE